MVVVASLYTLSCFQFIPKWDSVRGYLPYRFFISDYISNGHMPLWNPFQRLGYPGYCDLQSGAWYPLLWFILLLGQYDITSLIVEVVLCFLIAGWGMFTLSRWMIGCSKTASILAISYALSGFMVGSAQLMVFLIGVAWLPWILWSLLRLLDSGSPRYALWLAVFLMCNITGASPAFTIILFYIIPVVTLRFVWKNRRDWSYLTRLMKSVALCAGVLVLLLLPFIHAFLDFYPYFNRTGKLAYEDMIINPFVWADYISFLFPYSVISTGEMFQVTDLSLRNAYIGLVGLGFFLLSVTHRKYYSRWHWGLLAGCVMALWLALGDFSGIYCAVYEMPGFGLFRHPAFFRGYALLCMLLLAGFAMHTSIADNRFTRSTRNLLATFFALTAVVVYWSWSHTTWELIQRTMHEISVRFEFPAAGFESQLFLNAAVMGALVLMVAAMRWFFKMNVYHVLIGFTALDLFIQTQLTAPTTIHHGISYAQTEYYFDTLQTLPAHDQRFNSVPLKELDESQGLLQTAGLDRNLSTFNHTLSAVGENPMRFKAFDQANRSGRLKWVLENPLFYFPNKVCDATDSLCAGCIFDAPVQLDEIGDSALISNPEIGYNSYSAVVINESSHKRWLVLNANFHHLWRASLDEADLQIVPVNDVAMGVHVPPHTQGTVRFEYDSPYLRISWLLSVLTLLGALLWLWRAKHDVVVKTK